MAAVDSVQPERVRRTPSTKAGMATHFRWTICGLLFFATTLNYMDRQALALLKPTLQDPVRGIGMSEFQFAAIVSTFSAAYALGQLLAGSLIDRVGTRIGYAVALSIWTTAAMSHMLVSFTTVTAPLHAMAVFLSQLLRHVPRLASSPSLDSLANLSEAVTGFVLQKTHGNYMPVFILAGSAYLLAILLINLLVPRLQPAHID